MNELRSEIKTLMSSAADVPDARDHIAPLGFSARVVAISNLMERRSVRRIRWAFSIASGTAAVVIASCSVVLFQHQRTPDPASQIVTAAQFFAETISP